MLKIGDLVTATHWKNIICKIGIVVDNSRAKDVGIVRVSLLHNPDYEFDQLVQDLEKIA